MMPRTTLVSLSLHLVIVLAVTLVPISSQAETLNRTMFGSYWTTENGLNTILVINNPKSEPLPFTLRLYKHSGRLLATQRFTLGPTQSKDFSLRQIVQNPAFGRLQVDYPKKSGFVPAQVKIVSSDSVWIDSLLDGSTIKRTGGEALSLVPPVEGASHRPQKIILILTNVSDQAASGRILLQTSLESQEVPFAVGPGKTRRLTLTTTLTEEVGRLRILGLTDGLLLSGFTRTGADFFAPLNFFRESFADHSIFGFFSGSSPQLHLWNPGNDPSTASLSIISTENRSAPSVVTIDPNSVASLNIKEILNLPAGLTGVVEVRGDRVGELIGQIVSDDYPAVMSSLKPAEISKELAYNFPVRINPAVDRTSALDLFNPGEEELEIGVLLAFGSEKYTYPLRSLAPKQFTTVDFGEAQRVGLSDQFGKTIPPTATTGSVRVMVLDTSADARLVARIRQRTGDSKIGIESCAMCPLAITDMVIFPDPVIGTINTTETLNVVLTFEDGSQAPSFASRAFTGDPFIADVVATPPAISFISDGTTFVDAERDACLLYSVEPIGPFESGCVCSLNATLFDDATVVSRGPQGFDITVTSNPIAGQAQSVISGQTAKVQVRVRDASGQTLTSYLGTVSFSSSDSSATLPGPYTFTAADQGVHTFDITLKTVAGTSPTRDLTVSDSSAGITKTENLFVWFDVTMEAEFWKNCDFTSCPDLGSYVCTTACQTAGFSAPTPFIALTTSSASVCGQSVMVHHNGTTVTTVVQDKGPVLNSEYWNTGNIPSVGGCLSDALMDQLGISHGCNASNVPFGQGVVQWRFK